MADRERKLMALPATLDDIQALQDQIAPYLAALDAMRLQGLNTLLLMRAFTFANQKIRIDQYGMETNVPPIDSGTTIYSLWGVLNPQNGGDPSTQYPRWDVGSYYDSTNGVQFFFEARGAVDFYSQLQVKALLGGHDTSALMQSVISGVEASRVEAKGFSATASGYVQVSPALQLNFQTVDPTVINGALWNRNDLNRIRGQLNGTTLTLPWILQENGSGVYIVSSVAETSLLTQSIAGAQIEKFGVVRATIRGSYLNSTGADDTLRLKVKFGGTIQQDDTITITHNAAPRAFSLTVDLSNRDGTTNTQGLATHLVIGNAVAATAGYASSLTAAPFLDSIAYALPAKDTNGSAQTLDITAQLGTSSASISLYISQVLLELL